MKNVVIAATLVCALIGGSHAEAKTKNHNRSVQMVETAPQPQPGDGGYHQASGFEMVKAECELVANGLQPSPASSSAPQRRWPDTRSEAPSAA